MSPAPECVFHDTIAIGPMENFPVCVDSIRTGEPIAAHWRSRAAASRSGAVRIHFTLVVSRAAHVGGGPGELMRPVPTQAAASAIARMTAWRCIDRLSLDHGLKCQGREGFSISAAERSRRGVPCLRLWRFGRDGGDRSDGD